VGSKSLFFIQDGQKSKLFLIADCHSPGNMLLWGMTVSWAEVGVFVAATPGSGTVFYLLMQDVRS
jgi:hypothetical protein